MKKSIARLFALAGDYKQKMFFSVFLATLSVTLGILPLIIMYQVITDILSGRADPSSVRVMCLAAGLCLVMKPLAFGKATSLSHRVAYRILYNMRMKLADKFVELPLGFLTGRASGQLKKTMVDDVEKLELFLAHNIPETISNMIVPFFITIYMFFLDWRMALALLGSIPLSYIAFMFMFRDYRPRMEKFNASAEHVNSTIVEYIRGMAVIRTFNQSALSFKKYSSAISDYLYYVLEWFRACWPYMSAYFVLIASGTIIVIPVGAWFYSQGTLELPSYILFMLISLGFSAPFIKLTEFADSIALVVNAEESVNGIIEEPELYRTNLNLLPEDCDIKFSDVVFSYDDDEVLRNISFSAERNTTTALVGPSGGGKSTIAKLIARFWDVNSGKIMIGGVDIREIKQEELMNIVSFVFQDVFLFNDTIMENIRVGRKNASEEEIIEAAKLAMCHDFIMQTEDGYNTFVGDGGARLSGGERQRISIARAILRNAPVIVLDEATAYSDPENEDKIQESINNLTKDKTLIIIAHRLSTVMHSDKIIVINNGEIEDQGTHEELLQSSSLYESMWFSHIASMDWNLERSGEESNV